MGIIPDLLRRFQESQSEYVKEEIYNKYRDYGYQSIPEPEYEIKEFSKEYLERGLIYEVKTLEEIPKRSIGVCYSKKVSLSSGAIKFLEIIKG